MTVFEAERAFSKLGNQPKTWESASTRQNDLIILQFYQLKTSFIVMYRSRNYLIWNLDSKLTKG